LAGSSPSQLSALRCWTDGFPHRKLDDPTSDKLAGLPAFLLGMVGFAGQILTFFLAPFAGVWIEQLDRRRVLLWAQVFAAAESFALAVLTLSGHVVFWEVIALTAFQGAINAFDMPARQSFMVQMVDDRNDLGNAVAINSSMTNGTRLIGPALAGALIAAVGEGWCFLLDGLSYLAVIASLLAMRVQGTEQKRQSKSMFSQMREGWQCLDHDRTSRGLRSQVGGREDCSGSGWLPPGTLPC
jgi:MFS family permease